jgi:molybdate transport system ATP-binding protein
LAAQRQQSTRYSCVIRIKTDFQFTGGIFMAALVQFSDVHFAYRLEPTLTIDAWSWHADQHWAVIGGNGSGKTTLAKLIADRLRPQRGTIELLDSIDPERDVYYVSFDLQKELVEHDLRYDESNEREDAFDVGTSVRSAILQGRKTGGIADARFDELVDALGIHHILERGIRYISTGEGRKTLLARALLATPKILILDNPLEGLDRNARNEFAQLLETLLGGHPSTKEIPLLLLVPAGSELPQGITHVLQLDRGTPTFAGTRAEFVARGSRGSRRPNAIEQPLPPPLRSDFALPKNIPLLALDGVNVSYNDTPVLTDIHWHFERGQHCHVSGPNGAGKSTLLSLISGDNHKGYGQPLWLYGKKRGSGESVWEIKANCGIVNTPLQLTFVGRQRVLEVVASGLHDTIGLYDFCGGRERELTIDWIKAVGLEALAEHRFDQLSFGEQRLALLARAMVKSPPLLILDEPCLGLDGVHRDQFLMLVDRIAAQGHTQILYVNHVAEEMPACINQWLELVPHARGGSTARVTNR